MTRRTGYSLIELITVMVLIGALVAVASVFIVEPFRAGSDIARRAALVDQADLALGRIAREARTALPNSVRVTDDGTRFAVELVGTRTGGRYRRLPAAGGGGDTLNRAQAADTFDVLGGLPAIAAVVTGAAGTDCAAGGRDCISIYNTGQSGFDVYAQDNVAAITAKTDNAGSDQLAYDSGGGGPAFAAHSPRQRLFVVDDVVSFVCDLGDNRLLRYASYGLRPAQPLADGDFGVAPALVADAVSACGFSYQAGTASRQGLLTMRLELTRGGETITLHGQAHVVNAP